MSFPIIFLVIEFIFLEENGEIDCTLMLMTINSLFLLFSYTYWCLFLEKNGEINCTLMLMTITVIFLLFS